MSVFRYSFPVHFIIYPLIALIISACAPAPVVIEKPDQPRPVKIKPSPTVVEEVEEKVIPEPDVALILSSKANAYKDVALLLEKSLGDRAKRYVLMEDDKRNQQIFTDIQSSNRTQVVAIGLDAAELATRFTGKQVVFSQVFDFKDKGLLKDNMKVIRLMIRYRLLLVSLQ